MGRFSLQAEATSPTLVHVFVKATTTPTNPMFSFKGGTRRFVWDESRGLGKGCLGLGVPTHARGGRGDAPCPSPAGIP